MRAFRPPRVFSRTISTWSGAARLGAVPEEARKLLDSIESSTLIDLRGRDPICATSHSCARPDSVGIYILVVVLEIVRQLASDRKSVQEIRAGFSGTLLKTLVNGANDFDAHLDLRGLERGSADSSPMALELTHYQRTERSGVNV